MKKRGVGMGVMWYPVGPGGPNPSTARLVMDKNARMTLYVGSPDVGQGSSTALAQIAADTVGVPFEWIKVVATDSDSTVGDFGSVGSRVTYVQGNSVRMAAESMKARLLEAAQDMTKIPAQELEIGFGLPQDRKNALDIVKVARHAIDGKGALEISETFVPEGMVTDRVKGQGMVYPTYVYATQIVEVEVDTGTGEVTLLRMVAAHDSGVLLNPMLVEGQIAGGIAQGIGMAMSEEVMVSEGRVLNPSLSNYLIPTTMDIPELEFVHVEMPEETGPYGAKCVGEPALVATSPAILNAIYDAVGVRIISLPATPEKVLDAIYNQAPELVA